jgi:hypothetical protein
VSLRVRPDPTSLPENTAVHQEIASTLWTAVNQLKEKHCLPILLRYVHNLSIREIAEILETKEGTIHSRLHYVCQKSEAQLDLGEVPFDAQVKRKRHTRRLMLTARSFAMATAVLLIIFWGINWLVNNTFEPEPATAPMTAIPQPAATPTLAPKMKYADLLALAPRPVEHLLPEQYNQTVTQVAAQVDFDLSIPTQLNESISFVGAMVNPAHGGVEIAFISETKVRDRHLLWVWSQIPLTNDLELPLPTHYQPFADSEDIVIMLRAEYFVEILGTQGMYTAYEHITPEKEWAVVNAISWQANGRQDGRQFTLTAIAPAIIPPETMISMVQGFHLTSFKP